ncbi:MAG: PAS domain-containing protein [Actinobacteria bacterium]|nr:PAS domain-containing protein [Actinomycetota bacterium]
MNGRDTVTLNASLLLDEEDRILEGNRDAEVFLEKPLEEVRKTPLYKANPPLYSALKELLAKTKRGRGVEDYALAYKVGKRLMRLNINMSPYPLEALGTTGTMVTITSTGMRPAPERRAAREEAPPAPVPEEALGLPQFLDIQVEPAFMLDLDANFTYANAVMCEMLGHEQDEIVGRPLSFFLLKEEAKQALESLVEAARAAPWRGELEFNRGDGTTSSIAVTVNVLKNSHGGIDRLLGMGRDNTVEARIRREREDELQRVWSLLERVGVAVVCFTPDFRVTLLSHSAEKSLSTSSDRAIATPLPDLFPAHVRQEVVSMLERALGGEEIREALVQVGKEGERHTLFMSIRPAVTAGGRTREFMAMLREATRELSEMEEAEALLKVYKMKEEIMELAARSHGPQDFLEACLRGMQEEFGCSAAAFFAVQRAEAVLYAQLGLEEEEARMLSSLKLRPGHARLCGMLVRLNVEIHGGVPRRGWDEVHSFIEKADTLLPILRERRWRGLMVLPVRGGGEAAGALAMADCDAVKVEALEDTVITATGEAIASAVTALEARMAAGIATAGPMQEEVDVDADSAPGGGEDEPSAPGATEEDKAGDDESSRSTHGDKGGIIPTLAPAREKEHDYFEIAKEVKGEDALPDNLALFSESVADRSVPSSRGIDIAALLWDMKEYYGRGERKGEIFLEIEEDLPRLHTDKKLLREALMQLIDNARKFSPADAPVILGVERWGDEILLRIEDQGPGISAEVVEEIMGRELEEVEGKGMKVAVSGLYLCRKYVAAMGGDLTVKGRPGEGTTAFIRLRVLPFIGEGL